jgi:hypothetical protein
MLAMISSAPRASRIPASSLTSIASLLAPTGISAFNQFFIAVSGHTVSTFSEWSLSIPLMMVAVSAPPMTPPAPGVTP